MPIAWGLVWLVACGEMPSASAAAVDATDAVGSPQPAAVIDEPPPSYDDQKRAIARLRTDLAARYEAAATDEARAAIRAEAGDVAVDAITTGFFPAWTGTPWAFYGTTEEPGSGEIACGYYVSTTLRDAGFRVERVPMAQQPAENIIKTLVPPEQIRRYRKGDVFPVVKGVEGDGPGLYVVGLDNHVGYLWNDGTTVWMCHSSYLGNGGVQCEDALSSLAMVSNYHVVGKLMSDDMVDKWLTGAAFPTVRQ